LAAGLSIRAIMDSSAGDVFAFKTCCDLKVPDQNLEIQVRNVGDIEVVVRSRCELKGGGETMTIEYLMPHGEFALPPGDIKAFYCTMDAERWKRFKTLTMFDDRGNRYETSIA